MSRWLSIIGLSEGGWAEVSGLGRSLILAAELIVGGERHLAMLPQNVSGRRIGWSTPLKLSVEEILRHHGRPVVVLATGDPMHFGIGVTFARVLPQAEMLILPGASAFTLAAARLGWPFADCECLTLHGRPLVRFVGFLYPGARLLLLSHDGTTPSLVAAELTRRGWGPSLITVLEHMGGAQERGFDGTAETWSLPRTADLNTLAIECRPGRDASTLPRLPGLPDDSFIHDGQLTKREVRAATLAALSPLPGQRLWDIGAGCGSIAIEWLRSAHATKAIAIESNPKRCRFIADNAAAIGTPEIEIHAGGAPEALAELASPDAVFIGGGIGAPGLVERCWSALSAGGRLVANVVTVDGEIRHHARIGGSLTRIAISRAEPIGTHLGWRPLMPVTQWTAVKQ
jgi:precorrin-6B C5,15-methyltransferase / cobalt-precorrin-6B C5,C15-methyltransferase